MGETAGIDKEDDFIIIDAVAVTVAVADAVAVVYVQCSQHGFPSAVFASTTAIQKFRIP